MKRVSHAPFYVINRDEDLRSEKYETPDEGGMLWRNCTRDYKLRPLRRAVKAWMREQSPRVRHVHQYIGISRDEAHRMKQSGVRYITNEYPLVELGITRQGCLTWLAIRGYRKPPKSACHFCPYRSNRGWYEMATESPDEYGRAARFDEQLRTGKLPGVTGKPFVHRKLIPLSEVDHSAPPPPEKKFLQNDLFDEGWGNDCEGMCGV